MDGSTTDHHDPKVPVNVEVFLDVGSAGQQIIPGEISVIANEVDPPAKSGSSGNLGHKGKLEIVRYNCLLIAAIKNTGSRMRNLQKVKQCRLFNLVHSVFVRVVVWKGPLSHGVKDVGVEGCWIIDDVRLTNEF